MEKKDKDTRWSKEEEEYLDFIQNTEAKRIESLKKPTKKKLVRDLIPGIIAEEGKEVRMCAEIKGDSKIPYYFEKVQEELDELKEAWKDHISVKEDCVYEYKTKAENFKYVIEEAADLKESFEALVSVLEMKVPRAISAYGVARTVTEALDSEQIKKRVVKGGFAKGFIMEFDIEEEE